MTDLILLLLVVGALSLAITVVSHVAVLVARHRRPSSGPLPPISVLKPVKGAEPGLYENLAAIARQDYPEFEILIGAEDPDDPALAVARQVKCDFPQVPIRVVSGAPIIGHNPKVCNLSMLSQYARHDWVLVSDSNVRPEPGYLRAMTAELSDPTVGLVSSVLVGKGGNGMASRLDALLLNTLAVRATCGADLFFSHPCVIGKSMLFRLSELRRLGGFRSVSDVLAEDYVLGRMFQQAGHRVALSAHGLPTTSHLRSVYAFCQRHLRWAQMRRHLAPVYWGEPLLSSTNWFGGALVATALAPAGAVSNALLAWCVGGLAFRLLSDALLQRTLTGRWLGPEDVVCLLVKDSLLFAVWVIAIFRRRVNWRGNEMEIGPGSRLYPSRRVARALAGSA
jgi:ceramide glucosyltransferase